MAYRDQVQLRCFWFRYSNGDEVIRWLEPLFDRDAGWAQQVMSQRPRDGHIEHTENDKNAIFYMPGIKQLVDAGKCEEL